jgi:GNAT superfamily N-acetyltransferase
MVRPPAPGEEAMLAALMRAMEAHYGIAVAPGVAERAAATLCRGEGPGHCLVAPSEGHLAGAAFCSDLFPGPGLASVVYLKDLFVMAEARGRGIGAALMRAVAAAAQARGALRLEWATGADNLAARRFYAALGASEPAKICLQLDAAGMARLAGVLDPAGETRD